MNFLVYPKTKHIRSFNPKQYKRYQTYKRILRSEFGGVCVYCRMPDSLQSDHHFSVDHYKPSSIFPELKEKYDNLFYCCMECNSAKNAYWPDLTLNNPIYIPNPCDEIMTAHLKFSNGTVEAKSIAGQFTRDLLHLNDLEIVQYREDLLGLAKLAIRNLNELTALKKNVKKKIALGLIDSYEAPKKMAAVDISLDKAQRMIRRFLPFDS